MGYRCYQARHLPTAYPFGHGLSYTSFEIGPPAASGADFRPGERLVVEVPVTNTGERAGSEVVQCYVCPPPGRLFRPPAELKAFAKLFLQPGESKPARLELGDRAFAHWDPADHRWKVEPGTYRLAIARSSEDVVHHVEVEVEVEVVAE